MTNREMVKDPRGGGPKLPEPNVPQRVLVPAPEGDPDLFTTDDPVDSPQPNPVYTVAGGSPSTLSARRTIAECTLARWASLVGGQPSSSRACRI
jgi:hypothetical protein